MRCLLFTTLMLLTSSAVGGTINVPADHATIQEAIVAAVNGDEIIVAPGTYTGTGNTVVDLLGKRLHLRSSNGAEETIIDGENARQCVRCANGEPEGTIISGFTLTHGQSDNGGAVYTNQSRPLFRSCLFIENHATRGGAAFILGYGPIFEQCTMRNNSSDSLGGALYVVASHVLVDRCLIRNNTGDNCGGIFCDTFECYLKDSVMCENSGLQVWGSVLWDHETVISEICEPTACGDLNGDYLVKVEDILLLIGAWGNTGPGCILGDFDVNGVVAVDDLLYLMNVFGADCTPTGACCFDKWWCEENLTQDYCNSQGGIYQGDGSVCSWCGE